MVLVSEVASVIKMLADVVKSTREIIDAVNDGRKFLAMNHPEAQKDFSKLLSQMQQAIEGMARVTGVISGFRFVIVGRADDYAIASSELARFNNYVITQRTDIGKLKNDIRQLKADCDKVKDLRDKLDARSKDHSIGSLFGLLGGKAQQRTIELHGAISNFYADDQRMLQLFNETLDLAERAIRDVEEILGPPGTSNPYNLPEAANMLGTYSVLFDGPNRQLQGLANIMSDAQSALLSGADN